MRLLILSTLLSFSGWAQPVITYPNGGETLAPGSTVSITWTGTNLNDVVGIDYTIDNWTNTVWLSTNFQNPSANSYSWVVPNTPSTQCKVGVFNVAFQGDISDNFFTIASAAGLDPASDESAIQVYPNPAVNQFLLTNKTESDMECVVLDATGREVAGFEVARNEEVTFQQHSLNDGYYLLQLFSKEGALLSTKRILFN